MIFNENLSIGQKNALRYRMKHLRQSLNLTVNDFAEHLCCDPSYVYSTEDGENAWSDTILKLISYEFGISMTWLKTGKAANGDNKIVKDFDDITYSCVGVEEIIYDASLEDRHDLFSTKSVQKQADIENAFKNSLSRSEAVTLSNELDDYGLYCYDDGYHNGYKYATAVIKGMLGITNIPDEPPLK